jgi:glycosyltransferase involved in cell wall biosynthesis
MKIITLVPIKNEAYILKTFLENVSRFSDYIIIADQHSTDGSREIAQSFEKVILIDNDAQGHNNSVRWKLLEEARKIPGNNFMIALDADEMISPDWVGSIKKRFGAGGENLKQTPSTAFSFEWIQLWNSFEEYRVDGVWNKSMKTAAWIDDRTVDYERTEVLNDHTARIPTGPHQIMETADTPLLHFQFAFMERTAYKQAWYRMNEFLKGRDPRRINLAYASSKDDKKVRTQKVPKEWLGDIILPSKSADRSVDGHLPPSALSDWHKEEILKYFSQYGIMHFEPLDIWYIRELRDRFIKETGREPRARHFPFFIVWLILIRRTWKAL